MSLLFCNVEGAALCFRGNYWRVSPNYKSVSNLVRHNDGNSGIGLLKNFLDFISLHQERLTVRLVSGLGDAAPFFFLFLFLLLLVEN